MQPLVRRTWAPRGQTPVLSNWDRHDRITTLAALAYTPKAGRLQMHFGLQLHNATATDFVWFLHALHQELQRPMVVVWDRLGAHRKAARVLEALGVKWAKFEWLPPYCPELNPVEHVWSTAKWGRLCNWAAADREDLHDGVWDELSAQSLDSQLLASHFQHAGLSLSSSRRHQ